MQFIDFRESVLMALGALKANKLRAFLTLLGVSIGVFSFIGVMTGIEVLQNSIETSFNILGSNTLLVQKYPAIQTGPGSRMKYRNRKDLTVDHGWYVRERSKLAEYVNIQAGRGGGLLQYRNRKTNPSVFVFGGTPDIIHTQNREIASGRMFNEQELRYAKRVAVIGTDVVKFLFPHEDPLGKRIRVNGVEMTVIGVTAQKGGLFGGNQDNFALIPLTTYMNFFGNARHVSIQATAYNQESYDAMTDEIIGLLRTVRRVPPGEDNDFEIVSNESLITEFNSLTYMIRLGTAAVSAIALLAAGVGIMNIMLVSVSERTREIGIRKALGATRRVVLSQFLTEAVVICEIGGLIGVVLGLLGGNVLSVMMSIPPILPIGWALVGVGATTLIGVIFGVYPAWKASNLDPIEALRYE